jgi:hypothetical protein
MKKMAHQRVLGDFSVMARACVALMLRCDEYVRGVGMNTYA